MKLDNWTIRREKTTLKI